MKGNSGLSGLASIINFSPPPVGGFDPSASAFFMLSGVTDPGQQTAINNFVLSLKGAGIWSKMKAIYPFVGGTTLSHSINLVNAGVGTLTFDAASIHSADGFKLPTLGTGVQAVTNEINYDDVQPSNFHVGVSFRSPGLIDGTDNNGEIFLTTGGYYIQVYARNDDNNMYFASNSFAQFSSSPVLGTGFYCFTNDSPTSTTQYRDGIAIGAVVGLAAATPAGGELRLGNGAPPICFVTVGDSLTTGEVSTYSAAVETLQTALGR